MQDAVDSGAKKGSWPLTVSDPATPWSQKAYSVFGDLPESWILVGMGWFYDHPVWENLLQGEEEKSILSPVSHKYDVVPAPKADWAVKYLWGSRAGGLSWEGKAAHMQENYIFACCLSDICLPENKYTSRLERNWSYLCTLHP